VPARIEPLAITAYSATSALGRGLAAQLEGLRNARSGLHANDFSSAPLECRIGRVAGVEDVALPAPLAHWHCRNNCLAWLGLQQDGLPDAVAGAIARYGAARIALILGTSTASIGSTEDAYRRLDQGHFPGDLRRPEIHTPHSLTAFVADATGIAGPALTLSTACSSSAKVEQIVGSALTQRGWRIVKHVPGEVDAVYDPRSFSVTIAVHYDPQKIQINYVTSSNLRYEEKNGVRYIHKNYASWIKNLVTDIQNGLMMAK
jgi:hypothetical protein